MLIFEDLKKILSRENLAESSRKHIKRVYSM